METLCLIEVRISWVCVPDKDHQIVHFKMMEHLVYLNNVEMYNQMNTNNGLSFRSFLKN